MSDSAQVLDRMRNQRAEVERLDLEATDIRTAIRVTAEKAAKVMGEIKSARAAGDSIRFLSAKGEAEKIVEENTRLQERLTDVERAEEMVRAELASLAREEASLADSPLFISETPPTRTPPRTEETKRTRDALGSSSPPVSQSKRPRSGTRTAVEGSETRRGTPSTNVAHSPIPSMRSPSVVIQPNPLRGTPAPGGASRGAPVRSGGTRGGGPTPSAPVFSVKCERCVSRNERCVRGIGQACLPCRNARQRCSFVCEYLFIACRNLQD
jgi:hypothetical protein